MNKELVNKKLISLTIFIIIILLIVSLFKNNNYSTSSSYNIRIDSIIKNNDSLINLIKLNLILKQKDKDSILLLQQDKKILINHLYYKINELNNIKIHNSKIPNDSIFIILKQKYCEDSINNFN